MTFETLCIYTDDVDWDFSPLLNHYLHNKNKSGAPYLRQKMVNHLITAPCAGPHYLPHFSKFKSEGTEGWRAGYKWDSGYNNAMYGPDTTDLDKNWAGGKYNDLVDRTTVRTQDSPYPANVIITGETILLDGGHYFGGDGHTLEIIPDHKVTPCKIEEYFYN